MRLLDLEAKSNAACSRRAPRRVRAPAVQRSFHPKAFIFRAAGAGTAFIGSSNLSAAALRTAVEWNYRVVSSRAGGGFEEAHEAFDGLFGIRRAFGRIRRYVSRSFGLPDEVDYTNIPWRARASRRRRRRPQLRL
jgi:hypothetical protein